jgi:hypothetical protein
MRKAIIIIACVMLSALTVGSICVRGEPQKICAFGLTGIEIDSLDEQTFWCKNLDINEFEITYNMDDMYIAPEERIQGEAYIGRVNLGMLWTDPEHYQERGVDMPEISYEPNGKPARAVFIVDFISVFDCNPLFTLQFGTQIIGVWVYFESVVDPRTQHWSYKKRYFMSDGSPYLTEIESPNDIYTSRYTYGETEFFELNYREIGLFGHRACSIDLPVVDSVIIRTDYCKLKVSNYTIPPEPETPDPTDPPTEPVTPTDPTDPQGPPIVINPPVTPPSNNKPNETVTTESTKIKLPKGSMTLGLLALLSVGFVVATPIYLKIKGAD